MLQLKYLGYVLNRSDTHDAECHRKVDSGSIVAGAITSLVNARCLQLECARVLHEGFLMPILLFGSEIIIWREKERPVLGLFRWTTLEVCYVLGGWIESRVYGYGSYAE